MPILRLKTSVLGLIVCLNVFSLYDVYAEDRKEGGDDRPYWITKPQLPDDKYVYFVGIKTGAKSLESGRQKAIKDAVRQIVEYIGVRVSVKLVSQKSSLVTKLADEIKLYASADVRGTIIKEMYYEQNRKDKSYGVYILARYLKDEIEREKKRLKAVLEEYDREINELSKKIITKLRNENIKTISVGGFRELLSRRRFSFSNIIENDFKTKFISNNIEISDDSLSGCHLTGTYRIQGEDVVISVNILDIKNKTNIFAKNISIDKNAIEPDWLSMKNQENTFFQELEEAPVVDKKGGTISVVSRPTGAKIFLDGDYRGRTNVDMHQISVGPHNITLIVDGYKYYVKTIDIREDKITKIDISLEQLYGVLSISSRPPGAKVYIDRKYYGLTPQKISKLRVGKYKLMLKKEKYKDYHEDIDVVSENSIKRVINLLGEDGSLVISTDPVYAKVYLDSDYRGLAAPLFLEKVPYGNHKIRVEMEGYKLQEKQVFLGGAESKAITIKLKKMRTGIIEIYSVPSGAVVSVNDIEKGCTPIKLGNIPAGKHRIEVMKDEYYTWSGVVTVDAGKTVKILKQLKQ